jgi:hypothetical protein
VQDGDPTFGTTVEVWIGTALASDGAVDSDALTESGATLCSTVTLLNQAVEDDGASAAIASCGASGVTGSWVLVIARGTAEALQTLAICELGIEPKWFSDRLDMSGAADRSKSFEPDREYTCENQKALCKIGLRTLPDGVATPFDEVAILPKGATCGEDAGYAKGFGVNPLPGMDRAVGEKLLFQNLTYDADEGLLELPVLVGRPMTVDVETLVLCACLRPVVSFKPSWVRDPDSETFLVGDPCKPEDFSTLVGTLRITGSPYTWSFATAASFAAVLLWLGL